MHLFYISFIIITLFVNLLAGFNDRCRMDPFNKAVTVHSLKYICNNDELRNIFLNSKAGPFPPNSKFKGHILACPSGACDLLELMIESLWSGKNVVSSGGSWPNDHGFVTNNMLGTFDMFKAPFYRTIAPIDGKEAMAIDYANDLFLFILMDYVRKVQNNLFLGIVTFRPFFKTPIMYFLLEIVD
ncbi:uncharacterized protein LOC119084900 [Bradysia coprophila]|uniref:uncharacterized protein LOC119084900 n=1 Tax=Bradysia coprophila TaxID=38358 RepID=UPI00187DD3B8|nr:uncharacterized protein LOC119084900 [Bradysia coprophila]